MDSALPRHGTTLPRCGLALKKRRLWLRYTARSVRRVFAVDMGWENGHDDGVKPFFFAIFQVL